MTQYALTTQVRRWQFIALALIALVFGYIAGQLTPTANAQSRVQFDTSGCTNTETSTLGLTRGSIVTAAYVETSSTGRQSVKYVYATCR